MASLRTSNSFGNTSPSSLVRSANSVQTQVQAYNDSVAAYKYELSAKTDADLAEYSNYLNSRIKVLNTSGSIVDASKSLSLTKAMTSATHANVSATIQRENIMVMAGGANDQDKLNVITGQFQRALGIGDMALAQSLESQAYSLSQSIQYKAQEAANAAAALRDSAAKAASSAGGTSASHQNDVATTLSDNFKQLNVDTFVGGMALLNKNLKGWVAKNKDSLLALTKDPNIDPNAKAAIEKAVNTSQPNYIDIAQGVGAAMITAHYLAYRAELPINEQTANGYLAAATALANGDTKLKTLAGDRSLDEIATWQQNPQMFMPHENANTGKLTFTFGDEGKIGSTSSITGFKYDSEGRVIADFTGQASQDPITKQQADTINNTLQKVGLSFTKVKAGDTLNNGVDVQFTNKDKVPNFLKPVAGSLQNVIAKTYITAQGIQIATIDPNGQDHIYLVASDGSGKHALYQSTGTFPNGNPIFGKQVASGDYGFNQNSNSLWKGPTTTGSTMLKAHMYAGGPNITVDNGNMGSHLNAGSHTFDLNTLISGAQAQFYQVQQARIAAEQALAAQAAAAAHAAQFGAASTPAPNAAPIPIAKPAPRAVAAPTFNPQPMTYNPQPAPTSSTNTLQPAGQIHSNVQGIPLSQPKLNGIKL